MTQAEAAELRCQVIEDVLSDERVVTVRLSCTSDSLEVEKMKIGEPSGERGSEERAEWFKTWAGQRPADGDNREGFGGPCPCTTRCF